MFIYDLKVNFYLFILQMISFTGAILRRTSFPLPSLSYILATPNCTGDEDSIFNCSYSVIRSGLTSNSYYGAGVICQGVIIVCSSKCIISCSDL